MRVRLEGHVGNRPGERGRFIAAAALEAVWFTVLAWMAFRGG